jgi:serine protease Do
MLLAPVPVLAQSGDGNTNAEDIDPLVQAQQAVVQIEAFGSFVDPSEGMRLNVAGRGSGFIIDESGLAVTNNHVVTGAAFVKVRVAGEERPRSAKVLGVSECADLAVIDIEGDGFPALEWYPGKIRVGLEVYAAGFPLGDPEFTLTRGIISKARANGDTAWASVENVLEHDANLNPGNSGGPLLDAEGRVVGVNYAGNSSTGQFFAISKDLASSLVETLAGGQNVNAIGINGQAIAVTDEVTGIWISSVESGSPADRAGIQPGDVLLSMEGLLLATDGTMADYCNILRSHDADETLNVRVLRPSTEEVLTGQLNGRPLEQSFAFNELNKTVDTPTAPEQSQQTEAAPTYENYVAIEDDTGLISVEVPDVWADTTGLAWKSGDVDLGVSIAAAQDLDSFYGTWDEPGVFIGLSEDLIKDYTPAEYLDQIDLSDTCTYDDRFEFDDGTHSGFYDLWKNCGENDSVFFNLAITTETNDYMALIQMVLTADADLDALDHILSTFAVKTPEPPTIQRELPDPTDYVDTSTLTNTYVLVQDPAITLLLPDDWNDTASEQWIVNDKPIGRKFIAAPDVEKYANSWDAPGVTFFVTPTPFTGLGPKELLDIWKFDENCTYDDRFDYENTLGSFHYTGAYDLWLDCGDTGNALAVLAAVPDEKDHLVLMLFQATTLLDAEAFGVAQSSFFVADPNALLEVTAAESAAQTEFVSISDDAEYLTLEAPATWRQTESGVWQGSDGPVGVQLYAAADLDKFKTAWSEPGVFFGASAAFGANLAEEDALDALTYDACTYNDRFSLDKPGFSGAYDLWIECGGTDSVYAVVVAKPTAQPDLLLLLQVIIPDNQAFDVFEHILNTFDVDVTQDIDELIATLQKNQDQGASKDNLEVPAGTEPLVIIKVNALNVRTGPGTNYGRLGTVQQGDQLPVLAQINDCQWLQVRTSSNQIGWVSGSDRYVTLNTTCAEIAEAEAPAPPPTPTPAPETPPPSSSSSSSSGLDETKGCYMFQNQIGAEVTVTFTAKDRNWNKTFILAKNAEQVECFDPGKYTYTLDAPPPWGSSNGELKVEAGDRYLFPIQPRP